MNLIMELKWDVERLNLPPKALMGYFNEMYMFDNYAHHVDIHGSGEDRELIKGALRTACVAMERFEYWATVLSEIDSIWAANGEFRVDYWPDGDAARQIAPLFDLALRICAPKHKPLHVTHYIHDTAFRSATIRPPKQTEKAAASCTWAYK